MRGFLLDTCVVSEFTKTSPNLGLVEWLARVDASILFLSAATIGELQFGIALQPKGKRREFLERWLQSDVLVDFAERVLPFDKDVAARWGILRARARKSGTPAPVIDAIIAATALTHDLTLITRNVSDFQGGGVQVLNPWR